MSSRPFQVLLALSLLLNTFVLVGFVYRSWIEPPRFERRGPPPPPLQGTRNSALEMVVHDLDLDEAQRKALHEVLEKYAKVRRERLREIQKLRDQMADEYRQPKVDMSRINGLIDQLTVLRAEFQKDTLNSFNELEPQLSPEQREHLHRLLADRLAAPPMMRPPGPPPGPGQGPGTGRPSQ